MTHSSIATDEVGRREARLATRVRRRNAIEYVAAAVVGAIFLGFASGLLPLEDGTAGLVARIGSGVLVAGIIVVAMQLHWRGGAVAVRQREPSIGHYIGELRRQRDALRTMWMWYVLPLAPGFVLFYYGLGLAQAMDMTVVVIQAIATATVLWLVVRANRQAADCMEDEIREMRGMAQ